MLAWRAIMGASMCKQDMWLCFLFPLANTRHCLSIGVMHLLHVDGPCCAVLQLASDKQVNANRRPRLCFTASALCTHNLPFFIINRYCA